MRYFNDSGFCLDAKAVGDTRRKYATIRKFDNTASKLEILKIVERARFRFSLRFFLLNLDFFHIARGNKIGRRRPADFESEI